MKYQLNSHQDYKTKINILVIFKKFRPLLSGQKLHLILALIALLINSGLNLTIPFIIGKTIDLYITTKQYHGVLINSFWLLLMYFGTLIATYFQTKNMGTVGQNLLYNLRNSIFQKIQNLPISFFNQNKTGDLISRINNDTDNLNQFFSQALVQFIANTFLMIGAASFILFLDWRLGLWALAPALGIVIFTQLMSPILRQKNTKSLQSIGGMSAEIAESLDNFKVVVAYNRQDYFKSRFQEVNENNYQNALSAGFLNNTFSPVYSFASNIAQIIVLFYGIYLISIGNLSIGLLISYLTYLSRFYDPIRQVAGLWASFQTALGSYDRISEILNLKSDLIVEALPEPTPKSNAVLSFKNVSFHYPDGQNVLNKINFELLPGKTYAFVGPTGGGKTTTASLMSRLFDPTSGYILLHDRDLKTYTPEILSQKIGFILQEPYLFSGTVAQNLTYGNPNISESNLIKILKQEKLDNLIKLTLSVETLSLGQKQIVAFIRAILRKPDLLILDEATANIDTITEQLLENILNKLPKSTTKVIIAHRLNTIENADEIFFVNSGLVTPAGSLDHALKMLMENNRKS